VLKTLAKLTFGVAALAAATSFGTSPSHAYGDARADSCRESNQSSNE
jgi:hypothetical protein